MGSCPFQTVGYGATAQEAYHNACEEAKAERGHQHSYSGDIQTTEGFEMVSLKRGESVTERVEATIDNYHKWGPCGCIKLDKNRFIFYGWAAE